MKLSTEFGGSDQDTSRKLSLYLPNRDGARKPVKNMEFWIRAGMDLMTEINGGCTTYYNLPGSFEYENEEGGFEQINEQTHVLYSYIFKFDDFVKRSQEIRAFMYVYGIITKQHSIMIEYSGPNDFGAFETGAVYVKSSEMKRYLSSLKKNGIGEVLLDYIEKLKLQAKVK